MHSIYSRLQRPAPLAVLRLCALDSRNKGVAVWQPAPAHKYGGSGLGLVLTVEASKKYCVWACTDGSRARLC